MIRRPLLGLAAAWTLASSADNFMLFVLLWIAGPQGWSSAQLALLVVSIRLPTVVGGIVGGRAVDRFGPVQMLLADSSVRAVLMAALALVGRHQHLSVWVLLALCSLAGATAPFSYAAARTLVPRLVDDELLPRANALLSLGDQLPMLLGAALAGPAIALLGPGRAFLVPFVMMLGVLAIAVRLPRPAGVARRTSAPAKWASAPVIGLIGLSVAYYFTYGPFETVMPYFARQQLHTGVGGYALVWVLFGAAALATLTLAPWLARRRPGLANAVGATVWGLVTLPIVAAHNLPAAAAVFLVSGAVWGPYSAIETTALQRWADPSSHGAMFGTQRALLAIAAPAGAAVGALALERFTPAAVLAASALACTTAGLLALLPLHRR
jgi:predicted MFS family arabinose efflux permease